MIAPVLHLHEGPHPPVHALDHMARGFPHAHDVVDLHLVVQRQAKHHRRVAFGLHLVVVADHQIDLRHVAKAARLGLGGATGDDDAGLRIVAAGLAHGPPGLRDGL
ncbi:hypothetical protein D9M68_835630 [compost metagenome]